MKTMVLKTWLVPFLFLVTFRASATQGDTLSLADLDGMLQMDSIEKTFKYEKGTIKLKDGLATLQVPAGFKYLNAEQSNQVLTTFWGNPEDNTTLGMLFPDTSNPLNSTCWAFIITYDELGFVKDDDADDIDYDDLLTDMQKEMVEGNQEREKLGYEKVTLIGWAAKPYYDASKKILHWAFYTGQRNFSSVQQINTH